jgi:solute carrier family 35 protein E3|tara:strand:- start:6168 stop:7262 length:1095 start_codon:yes stop_codon:yes gene_type:complete
VCDDVGVPRGVATRPRAACSSARASVDANHDRESVHESVVMSIAASSSRLSTADAMKWASNFVSSVAIVMVNKQLMGASGLAFQYATTLCGMHFLCTMSVRWCRPRGAAAARAEAAKGGRELPQKKLLAFVAVASTSIISLNLSLMLNHVGFYQLAKLLQIPAVCLIEVAFFGRKVSWALARAIGVVMFGVGIATLQETTMNFWGTIVAAIAVLSTSAQQILVSRLQSEYSISSNDLLGRTAPLMALAMLTVGPFLDQILTGSFITDYYWTGESVMFLSASCLLAIWVNISQYMCIGTFSALSFQVIGHVKTVFIFFFGWLLFDIPVTWNNVIGGLVAIAGISYYSHIASLEKENAAQTRRPSV